MLRALTLALLAFTLMAQAAPIKIGVIGPFSGAYAFWGEPYRNSIILAYEELGLSADQVEVIYEDWGDQWTRIPTAARKLMTVDKVDVIINTFDKATHIVAPIAREHKVPQISLSLDDRPADGKYTFTVWTPVQKTTKLLLDRAHAAGVKTIALFVLKDYFPYRTQLEIRKQVPSYPGMQIVYQDTFDPSLRDFRTLVLKSRQSPADLTVVIGYPPSANLLYRQLLSDGVKNITSIETFDQLGEEMSLIPEGAYWVGASDNSADFQARYLKRFGKYDAFTGPTYGYDCLKLAVKALQTDREHFADALKSITVDGAGGLVHITASGAADMKALLKERREGKTVTVGEL